MAPAPDPAGTEPDPARMELFLARHAEGAVALLMKRPVSAGFAVSTLDGDRITRVDPRRGTIDQVSSPPGEQCTDLD